MDTYPPSDPSHYQSHQTQKDKSLWLILVILFLIWRLHTLISLYWKVYALRHIQRFSSRSGGQGGSSYLLSPTDEEASSPTGTTTGTTGTTTGLTGGLGLSGLSGPSGLSENTEDWMIRLHHATSQVRHTFLQLLFLAFLVSHWIIRSASYYYQEPGHGYPTPGPGDRPPHYPHPITSNWTTDETGDMGDKERALNTAVWIGWTIFSLSLIQILVYLVLDPIQASSYKLFSRRHSRSHGFPVSSSQGIGMGGIRGGRGRGGTGYVWFLPNLYGRLNSNGNGVAWMDVLFESVKFVLILVVVVVGMQVAYSRY